MEGDVLAVVQPLQLVAHVLEQQTVLLGVDLQKRPKTMGYESTGELYQPNVEQLRGQFLPKLVFQDQEAFSKSGHEKLNLRAGLYAFVADLINVV